MKPSNTAVRRMLFSLLAMAALGPAQALSCPQTLPTQTLSSSPDGAAIATNVTLRSSISNPAGTTILCRYKGTKTIYPSRGGNPVPGGTVYFDRSATTGSGDPAQGWTVRLFNLDNKFWCTGAAIAPDWVLTAYHCTDSPNDVQVGSAVKGGVSQRQTCVYTPRKTCFPNPLVQSVAVARIHSAPEGDIALLQLASPLVLTQYGSPVHGKDFFGRMEDSVQCLTGVNCKRFSGTLYGWTCDDPSKCSQGRDAVDAQALRFWANGDCGTHFYGRTDKDLCSTGGRDAAEQDGNSGGPLVSSGAIAGVFTGDSPLTNSGNLQFANVSEVTVWISGLVGLEAHPKPL